MVLCSPLLSLSCSTLLCSHWSPTLSYFRLSLSLSVSFDLLHSSLAANRQSPVNASLSQSVSTLNPLVHWSVSLSHTVCGVHNGEVNWRFWFCTKLGDFLSLSCYFCLWFVVHCWVFLWARNSLFKAMFYVFVITGLHVISWIYNFSLNFVNENNKFFLVYCVLNFQDKKFLWRKIKNGLSYCWIP